MISRDVKFYEDGDRTVIVDAETAEIDITKVEDITAPHTPSRDNDGSKTDDNDDEGNSTPTQQEPQGNQITPEAPLRRSTRSSKPPGEWWKPPAISAQVINDSALAA